MSIIAMVIMVLVAERCAPYASWGMLGIFAEKSEQEFITAYGLLSFPRTVFGVSVMLSSLVDYYFPGLFADVLFIASLAAYVATMMFDIFRAAR